MTHLQDEPDYDDDGSVDDGGDPSDEEDYSSSDDTTEQDLDDRLLRQQCLIAELLQEQRAHQRELQELHSEFVQEQEQYIRQSEQMQLLHRGMQAAAASIVETQTSMELQAHSMASVRQELMEMEQQRDDWQRHAMLEDEFEDDASWEEMYQQLVDHQIEHSTTRCTPENGKLHLFVQTQALHKRCGLLRQDREERLDRIEFDYGQ